MATGTPHPIGARSLVVVDADLGAYRELSELAGEGRLRLTLTSTGRSALRLAPSFVDAVWLVSPQLPDMDGLDLIDMLHTLHERLRAVVIDSEYDRDREIRALQRRAIQYVCKPLHSSWLASWSPPEAFPRYANHPQATPGGSSPA